METIDINKVAGLQALDSEGNVLGVVSMEQLTDMVAGKLATELAAQNTAPAMRTMSLTASPAAASVAATGVDKTEGQLGDVTDPGYVRVLDKNGNSGKQGISQFASVVGGLLESNMLYPYMDRGELKASDDLNNITTSGYYKIFGGCINTPLDINFAILTVTNSSLYISQEIKTVGGGTSSIYIRTRSSNNLWTSWAKLV